MTSEDTSSGKSKREYAQHSVTSMVDPNSILQSNFELDIPMDPNEIFQQTLRCITGAQEPQTEPQTAILTNSDSAQHGGVLPHTETLGGLQVLLPSSQMLVQTASKDKETYVLPTTLSATSPPQMVIITPPTLPSQTMKKGDSQAKREIRMRKNREASRQFRKRRKEYVKSLEERIAILEIENRILLEDLKTLKQSLSYTSV
ncbi:PREDICTED: cyclic AMP-dependent transcription factor ATF-1-like [Elephantulus edwardii]|uniref:cyclic AMP-dependent transcription factor ATF-1-like n=1 Tax=Elephantulus edwardii TaxID=28737 RepID=UPI0003F06DAE|nr:PREDICTED: cyclic AMP-dependent transcription factor ATF-1-like [Elephantulus edwardii]